MTAPLTPPSVPAVDRPHITAPAASRSGVLILPRTVSIGFAVLIITGVFGAGAWTAALTHRVSALESEYSKALKRQEAASTTLQRIERTLCALCLAQADKSACSQSCGL